jgi:hypothetical protein
VDLFPERRRHLFSSGRPAIHWGGAALPCVCRHFAAQVVQRGKESHRLVPIVIMGGGGYGPVPSGRLVWVHSRAWHWPVSPHSKKPRRFAEGSSKSEDVTVFSVKLQIVGQFEAMHPVRGNAVRGPKPLNRPFAQPRCGRRIPPPPQAPPLAARVGFDRQATHIQKKKAKV